MIQQGNERLLDIGGGLVLALPPAATDFDSNDDAEHGVWFRDGEATIEVRRKSVDADRMKKIDADARSIYEVMMIIGDAFTPSETMPAIATRAWATELGMLRGIVHGPLRGGGHTTSFSAPRYVWSGVFVYRGAMVVVTYVVTVGGVEEELDEADIVERGRAQHRRRAEALFLSIRKR